MLTFKILDSAISKKQTISFKYDNLDRVVEPHHYGILKHTQQLQGYQTGGGSKSGTIPAWRNFKLEKIMNLVLNDSVFTTELSYNPSNSKYQKIIKKADTNPTEYNKNVLVIPRYKRVNRGRTFTGYV